MIKTATSTIKSAYGVEVDPPITYEYSWESNGNNEHKRKSIARLKAMHKVLIEHGYDAPQRLKE